MFVLLFRMSCLLVLLFVKELSSLCQSCDDEDIANVGDLDNALSRRQQQIDGEFLLHSVDFIKIINVLLKRSPAEVSFVPFEIRFSFRRLGPQRGGTDEPCKSG